MLTYYTCHVSVEKTRNLIEKSDYFTITSLQGKLGKCYLSHFVGWLQVDIEIGHNNLLFGCWKIIVPSRTTQLVIRWNLWTPYTKFITFHVVHEWSHDITCIYFYILLLAFSLFPALRNFQRVFKEVQMIMTEFVEEFRNSFWLMPWDIRNNHFNRV